ncbi:hypothetical protein ABH930_006407 [Kitasatospora sp. GAS204A]|uniref:hypothetical protein n=1 Tax=unclassified Kitasatospora TaxID=2633591 RepID=UPI002474CB9C|nr:hypothetical protein [Kitasatospora sp. GAS204B]MDH6122001.1 hypothetical protein [Kitasatospora sp. GAS204B]
MRTAQELAAMTYAEVKTAWHRFEISQVEKDAWHLAFDGQHLPRRMKPLPESIALADEIKAAATARPSL